MIFLRRSNESLIQNQNLDELRAADVEAAPPTQSNARQEVKSTEAQQEFGCM